MRCTEARMLLNRLVDGETVSVRFASSLAGHWVRCAKCRAVQRLLRGQRRQARSLPAGPVPEELRRRVLAALPTATVEETDLARADNAVSRRRIGWGGYVRVGAAGVLAGTVVLFGLLAERRSLAADVRNALARTNTWHLHGWKLIDGKRVVWDVWGRRTPFFYRKQVGDAVTLDDGKERIVVMPPLSGSTAPGTVLRTTSRPADEDTGWSFERQFRDWREWRRPWAETRDAVVINLNSAGMEGYGTRSDYLYTINRRTSLPVHYELLRHDEHGHTTLAEMLDAAYNIPIPSSLASPRWPSTYEVTDTTTAPALNFGDDHVASKNGITVELRPLARDAEGRVFVRARGWLGDRPLKNDGRFVFDLQGPGAIGFDEVWPLADDRGRLYVLARSIALGASSPPGDWQGIFAPLEPLPPDAPPAKSLCLTLKAAAAAPEPMSGRSGIVQMGAVVRESLTWNLTLPDAIQPIDLEAYSQPDWRKWNHGFVEESVDAMVAYARSFYYGRYVDSRDHSPEARERRRNAIRWRERYVELAPKDDGFAQLMRMEIARDYKDLGDRAGQIRTLKEALAVGRQFPGKVRPSPETMARDELRKLGEPPETGPE